MKLWSVTLVIKWKELMTPKLKIINLIDKLKFANNGLTER